MSIATKNNFLSDLYNEAPEYKINNDISIYEKDNLDNKLYLLEKKYEIKETEYIKKIQSLNNQILLIKESHSQLKKQISLKDKALAEFNSLIKEYQIELLNYKQKLEVKNQKIEELKSKINLFKLNNDILSDVLVNNKNMESDLNKALTDKIRQDLKIKELKAVNEEKKITIDNTNEYQYDKQKGELMRENQRLMYENEKLRKKINNMKNDYENIVNNLTNKNIESEKYFNSRNKKVFDKVKHKNNLLDNNAIIKNTIKALQLEKNYTEYKLDDESTDINKIIKESNENIDIICKWIEDYMLINSNNLWDKNQNLPKFFTNGYTKENKKYKINFNKLMQVLQEARAKIINEQKDKNKSLLQYKKREEENRNSDIIEIINKYNGKNKIKQIIDEIKIIYEKLKEELKTEKYFNNAENKYNDKNISDINIINNLKNIIEDILKYINSIKNLKKGKKEEKKNEDIESLEENKKLNQMNKILEKKIKNLETNIELKQMEINSLQEIIERRSNIIDDTKNFDDIQKLEKDKEKLIEDNVKLFNKNKKLEELLNEEKLNKTYLTQ